MEKQKLMNANNSKVVNILRTFLLSALCIVIFYPPYLQGLFFEKHQLPTEILVFLLFIIFWVYKWLKKEYTFLKTPIEFIAVGFIAVYLISIFSAVHTRSAIMEVLKYCMYFVVFFMVTELADNIKTKTMFLWTIVVSATGVSVIGLNSAMGGTLVAALNKFFTRLGVEGDLLFGLFVGGRIHSTIQYPNALASYVMAVFFIVIGLMLSENTMWMKALYGVFSYILFLTFMLTKSRGAQLLFPVAILVFMIVSPKKTRIKAFFHIILLAIPAVGVSLFILPYLSPNEIQKQALILFAAGMLISAFLAIIAELIGDFLQKIHWLVYTVLLVMIMVLLPIGIYHLVNASVPLKLSHGLDEPNSFITVAREISLPPGNYDLWFEAEAKAEAEQPYIYSVSVSSQTGDDILFGGRTTLTTKTYKEASDFRQESIQFSVPQDSNLVLVSFVNRYSGTSVTLQNAYISEPITGEIIQKVILKNKYNMEDVITRFQNISQERSGIVRVLFYKDGLKILKDRWLLGGGGGAWEYLYRQYQSYSYSSSQAHNYPLQLGIEAGIPGFLALLGLLLLLVVGYLGYVRKTRSKPSSELFINTAVITAITSLFMHSVIDFDFSESAILLLFWQLIALFNRELRDCQVFNVIKASEAEKKQTKKSSIVSVFGGLLAGVLVFGYSVCLYTAAQNAKEAFRHLQQNKTEEALESIKRAISLDKLNEKYVMGFNPIASRPDIKAGLIDILLTKVDSVQEKLDKGDELQEAEVQKLKQQFSEMNNQVSKLEKEADYNLILMANLASYHFQMGDAVKGIDLLNRVIQLSPFEPSLWHSKINVYFQLAGTYYNNQDYKIADEYLDEGLRIIQEAKDVNHRNMNPFVFSQETIAILQRMKYMRDYYDKEEFKYINQVVHYMIPDLDINLDQIPDQWRSSDSGLINISTSDQGIQVHANGSNYISTTNTMKFKNGKTYSIEIELDREVDKITISIANLTKSITLKAQEENRYMAEFSVDMDPSEQGNQLRIFLNSDCVIKKILLLELE